MEKKFNPYVVGGLARRIELLEKRMDRIQQRLERMEGILSRLISS